MYILCRNCEKFVQLLLNIFLCFSKSVAASRSVSMFLEKPETASKRYQYSTASERKCAAEDWVAASGNISMFF